MDVLTRKTAKVFYDGRNIVSLEETNPGDAGGSGGEAGVGVCQRNSAESEHRDVLHACFPESTEACRLRVLFLENRTEHGEARVLCCGSGCFWWRVTGDCYPRTLW